MIKTIREQNKNILLLDSGDSFTSASSAPGLEAKVVIQGMNCMGYDALNVADGELSLGLSLFDQLKQEAKFPFLAANIFLDEKGLPVGERYLIKEFDGFNVSVVGVASRECFDEEFFSKTNLVVKDPEAVLREVLPDLEAKTDLIVVLSHLGLTATEDLVGKFHSIDVAIVGHESRPPVLSKYVGETIVAQGVAKGRSLGILDLRFDQDGLLIGHKGEARVLSRSTPVDPAVQDLVRKFRVEKTSLSRAKRAKQMRDDLMKKNAQFLKMSPEEFIMEMKKQDRLTKPEAATQTNSSNETQSRFPGDHD